LAVALVACWFLAQAHVRVHDELSRMVEESWAGGQVSTTLVDPVAEELTFAAARRFHSGGMAETSFLPCYEGFASESPISDRLTGDCVYTHFLPGPEYVLAALFAVFGDSDEALMRMRLLPLLLVLAAALGLVLAAVRYALGGWRWGAGLLLVGLLVPPAVSLWSLSLYGHGYSNACILAALALGLVASDPPARGARRTLLVVAAFFLGALSNLFLLEAAFVVCAAPLVGYLLGRGPAPRRLALQLTGWVLAGLCVAWLVHLGQVAHHLGSLSLALEDQFGTAMLRAENRGAPSRFGMFSAVSEATAGMFGIGALPMLVTGVLAAWLHRSAGGQRRRCAQALLLAALACYLFPLLLKHHGVLHMYRLPRIFLLLFACWLVVWTSLVQERLSALSAAAKGPALGAALLGFVLSASLSLGWLGLASCDGHLCTEGEALQLYQQRIEPLLTSDRPATCNQCHLSGVDLSNFLQETPCQTMACMVSSGVVDLESPEDSLVLGWIRKASPDSALITDAVIEQEYQGFLAWIDYHASCGARVCEEVESPCGVPPRHTDCEIPVANVFIPMPSDAPDDCREVSLEQLFADKVYSLRGRCYPCHFDSNFDVENPAPRWISTGDCAIGSLKTLRNVLDNGYVDVDALYDSLLLTKPLAEFSGGVDHGGHDKFMDSNDAGYQDFLLWLARYQRCTSPPSDLLKGSPSP